MLTDMTNASLNQSSRFFFAELENAILKDKLDKIRRTIQRKAPSLYDRMEAKKLFDLAIIDPESPETRTNEAAPQKTADPAE